MKRMMVKMMRDIMENMRVSEIIHSIVMNIYGMNGYSEQIYKWMQDKVQTILHSRNDKYLWHDGKNGYEINISYCYKRTQLKGYGRTLVMITG
jgi:hypothetical protein